MTVQHETFTKGILPLFEYSQPDWIEVARAKAVEIALRHPNFDCTIDEVRAECPPPDGADPRIMGSVFLCSAKGDWEKIGYVQSKRKACHGRPVALFRLKSPDSMKARSQ